MKRNWDMMREILTGLEDLPDTNATPRLSHFQSDRASECLYHMELLLEAGLADWRMDRTIANRPADFRL